MEQFTKAKQVDSEALSSGETPSQTALDDSRQNELYYITHRQQGELLKYIGWPGDIGTTATNINGGGGADFYCIFPVVKPSAGTKIRIGVEASHWDYTETGGALVDARWDDSTRTGNVSNITTTESDAQKGDRSSPPAGMTIRDCVDIDYDNNSVGQYGYVKFSYDYLCPAAVTMMTMPLTYQELVDLDPDGWAEPYFYMDDDAFNIGQAVRGADVAGGTSGSVGELCQRQGTLNDGEASMLDSSARCLFQWGYPAGSYAAAPTSTGVYYDMFDIPISIRTRGAATRADIVVVARANTGAKIKITAGSGGAFEYTFTAFTNTSQLTHLGSVEISKIDTLNFELYCTDEIGVEIQTIAAFEYQNE